MATNSLRSRARLAKDPLAGWDIAIAAFALACMTSGFWRLWPDALALNDAPLGPIVLKAGLAALGFVGIASRWEASLSGVIRNPFGLVLIALACASAVWAVVPSQALRHGILLLVMWGFGMSLSLRFKSAELAEICGFAGIFGVVMQVTAHKGVPPVDHFDGDLAFALIGCAWATLATPARRTIWLIATGLCFACAFAATERATFGAILGFVFGLGVVTASNAIVKRGAVSVLIAAWVIVAAIVALTLFALFGAAPVADNVSRFFTDLGAAMIIGQGFGVAGQSVGDSLGAGLGLLGSCVGGLVILSKFFQALFGNPAGRQALMGRAGVCFACVGAIVVAPQEVAMFGPILVLFAATSFAISLACAPTPQRHRSLFEGQKLRPAPRPTPARPLQVAQKPSLRTKPPSGVPAAGLTQLGLRPRR
jgi:hypothetical protein